MTTISLQLDSRVEKQLREKACLRGQSLETYLQQVVEESVRDADRAPVPAAVSASATGSVESWCSAWRAWAASHTTLPTVADDSRESIYAGKGE